MEGAKLHLPDHGKVLLTVRNTDKEEVVGLAKRFWDLGYQLVATEGTAAVLKQNGLPVETVEKLTESTQILNEIKEHEIRTVINTIADDPDSASDGIKIRQTALTYGVPLFTALDTADAILQVLEAQAFTTVHL